MRPTGILLAFVFLPLAVACTAAPTAQSPSASSAAPSPTSGRSPSPPTESPAPSPSVLVVGVAKLSADGCAFSAAAGSLSEGAVEFEVANDLGETGAFDVVQIAAGATFEEVVAHIALENRRADSGLAPAGFPSSAESLGQQELAPGGTGSIGIVASRGTLGIVCLVRPGPDPLRFYLIGPLEVSAR